MDFDVIPFQDIQGDWRRLGSGSFGNVYKGVYLGIDVAIKEVLPSKDYDVAKYFEREWRLMKEARHPNVVLFLGLSRAPAPDNRIFIVSEFIDNGNLRQLIHDTRQPLGWPLRLSILTDIARAMAYLHARRCIHRDLKGENLLMTSNGRVKVTDFGFARIAARDEDESRRLTFCGTDSYMSPEILLGEEFDLPTDVFSMGVIFCEVIARRLADDNVFKRSAPHWGMDPDEVRARASPGCPPDLIELALDMCATNPEARPVMRDVLARLRTIELAILEQAGDAHVGSIKFFTAGGRKRPAPAPRIPSFGMGVGSEIRNNGEAKKEPQPDDGSDKELDDAVRTLDKIRISKGPPNVVPPEHGRTPASEKSRWESPRWDGDSMYYTQRSGDFGYIPSEPGSDSASPLLQDAPTVVAQDPAAASPSSFHDPVPQSRFSNYSETVVQMHGGDLRTSTPSVASTAQPSNIATANPPELEDTTSVMTVRASPLINMGGLPSPVRQTEESAMSTDDARQASNLLRVDPGSRMSIDSYHTASSAIPPRPTDSVEMGSIAGATEGSHAEPSYIHRWTIIKPGSARKGSFSGSSSPPGGRILSPRGTSPPPPDHTPAWSPFEFFFGSGYGAKCDLCAKRLGWGWKPVMECDDCGMRAHLKCGEFAPMNCGIRMPPLPTSVSSPPMSPKYKNPRRRSGEGA